MKATSNPVPAASLAVLVLSLVGAAGCDSRGPERSGGIGEDPFAALSAGSASAEYDGAFWGEELRNETELWERAAAYCDGKDGNQYPNCRPVRSLLLYQRTLDRPRTVSPGFDGSMDMTNGVESAQSRLDSLNSLR